MLIVDKHCSDVCCDKSPVPQIDRQRNYVKNSNMENFIRNQYREKLAILNTENIKICVSEYICIFVYKYLWYFVYQS